MPFEDDVDHIVFIQRSMCEDTLLGDVIRLVFFRVLVRCMNLEKVGTRRSSCFFSCVARLSKLEARRSGRMRVNISILGTPDEPCIHIY